MQAVAVGDGALGFWSALREVWPQNREQRDWFHRLGNVPDKLRDQKPCLDPIEGSTDSQ